MKKDKSRDEKEANNNKTQDRPDPKTPSDEVRVFVQRQARQRGKCMKKPLVPKHLLGIVNRPDNLLGAGNTKMAGCLSLLLFFILSHRTSVASWVHHHPDLKLHFPACPAAGEIKFYPVSRKGTQCVKYP